MTMLRLHLRQELFGVRNFAMEEALFETPLYCSFAGLGINAGLPDLVSILRYRHMLEKQFLDTANAMLKVRGLMLLSVTVIAAPSSSKNNSGKREETHDMAINWHVAMRLAKRRPLDKTTMLGAITDQIEKLNASISSEVEHPFRVIMRQFGHIKVRYRGLTTCTAQLFTLFMLSNL